MKPKMQLHKSTERQQAAIRFCEFWLSVDFTGNKESFKECSDFLSKHLKNAKERSIKMKEIMDIYAEYFEDLAAEYEAYMWEKL